MGPEFCDVIIMQLSSLFGRVCVVYSWLTCSLTRASHDVYTSHKSLQHDGNSLTCQYGLNDKERKNKNKK